MVLNSVSGARVEVAVAGTALPVLVSVSPSPVFKFGDCPVGEQVDSLCTINNESASLPLAFSLQVLMFSTLVLRSIITERKTF